MLRLLASQRGVLKKGVLGFVGVVNNEEIVSHIKLDNDNHQDLSLGSKTIGFSVKTPKTC